MSRIKKQIIALSLVSLIYIFFAGAAFGQTPIGDAMTSGPNKIGGGVEAMVKAAYGEVDTKQGMVGALVKIVNYLLTFLAILFFLALIYAGYLWMTARGNQEQIVKAKKITREIVVGLIIILLSRLLTEFILFSIGAATK